MTPRTLRLAVLGDVGGTVHHAGDEAMLQANLDWLSRSCDLAPVVLGRGAGAAEIESAVAAADGVLLSGGGNLSSTWPDLVQQRLVLLDAATRAGVPVVTGGQTIGPDLSPAEADALGARLRDVSLLGVRELPSAALVLSLGVAPERVMYQVDDAYWLEAAAPPEDIVPDAPFIAVTLDPGFEAELGPLAEQVAAVAIEGELAVLFIPHVGELGRDDGGDAAVGQSLRTHLEGRGVRCGVAPVLDAKQIAWLTARAAAVVSSRYHPLVFAAAAGVPSLGMYRGAYTRIKLEGALAHVGQERWVLSGEQAVRGALEAALRRLWSQREVVAAALEEMAEAIAERERRRRSVVLARLGVAPAPAQGGAEPLGWPARELALRALGDLARERADRQHELQEQTRGRRRAEEYAKSLEHELGKLRADHAEAETYARSLEMDRDRQADIATGLKRRLGLPLTD